MSVTVTNGHAAQHAHSAIGRVWELPGKSGRLSATRAGAMGQTLGRDFALDVPQPPAAARRGTSVARDTDPSAWHDDTVTGIKRP